MEEVLESICLGPHIVNDPGREINLVRSFSQAAVCCVDV